MTVLLLLLWAFSKHAVKGGFGYTYKTAAAAAAAVCAYICAYVKQRGGDGREHQQAEEAHHHLAFLAAQPMNESSPKALLGLVRLPSRAHWTSYTHTYSTRNDFSCGWVVGD